MKKIFLIFLSIFFVSLNPPPIEAAESEFTIIFVHIGPSMPDYLDWALMQARLFNDCKIVLIANQEPINHHKELLETYNIEAIACETLKKSPRHQHFIKNSPLDKNFRGGFWFFASQRFFYLDDFMQQYQIKNVVHLESDVMLYVSLRDIASVLLQNYSGLGVTFDMDDRCIPGIVFIKDSKTLSSLTQLMMNLNGKDDMFAIGEFRDQMGDEIVKTLPIVQAEYMQTHTIKSSRPNDYSNLVNEFHSLFDAAYFGQYLGGQDPRNGPGGTYVNPHCVINSSFLEYSWEKDEQDRLVPFATFQGKKLRINNLHIHCKRLWDFYSKK